MEQPYELTYGDELHYARAYTLHVRDRVLVFVGEATERMTWERKAAMYAGALDVLGAGWRDREDAPGTDVLARMWERTPFIRRDDVTVRECVCTRVADGVDTMHTWDYSDAHGGGSWRYDGTTFLAWDRQAGTFVPVTN